MKIFKKKIKNFSKKKIIFKILYVQCESATRGKRRGERGAASVAWLPVTNTRPREEPGLRVKCVGECVRETVVQKTEREAQIAEYAAWTT